MMLEIAICDDEEYFLEQEKELISRYMNRFGYQFRIDTFVSGVEFMAVGDRISKYDIVFLDINMREMNGLETARKIRQYTKEAYIVFVTAFITYSLEGYKVDAVRYILKDNDSLEKAIIECLDTIICKMHYVENKYTFDFQEGRKTLFLDDILYIESNLHKLVFHLTGKKSGRYTIYGRLDYIDEMLHDFNFCRVHKSYLVNLKYMEKVERYSARLSTGDTVSISQPKYNDVREQFIYYKGEI
ncbi:MAG: LytTR family DNA-binding domain-containing protein [Lachnospiraceae bacterium]|nr:LytTR family DNA-binding domain-containing protein [Lachnospiraceae bacterium]